MALPQITMVGNLTEDPDLRFTPGGHAVARLRVACNDRRRDPVTNDVKDGDSCYLSVELWRDDATAAAENLTKGRRVVVTGQLRLRPYETQQGEKRSAYEVINASVGYQPPREPVQGGYQAGAPRASAPAPAPAPAPAQAQAAQAGPPAPPAPQAGILSEAPF